MAENRKTEIDIDEISTPLGEESNKEDAAKVEEAPEETPPEQKGVIEGKKKKAGKKKLTVVTIVLIVFGVLLFFIGEVVVIYFIFAPKKEAEKKAIEVAAVKKVLFNSFYVGTFFLPLKGNNSKEELFFKISIEAEYGNEESLKELSSIKNYLRNSIYALLKEKKLEDVNGKEKKGQLNRQIFLQISDSLDEGKIEKILFTEYLII